MYYESKNDSVQCICNHTTNFAIILQVVKPKVSIAYSLFVSSNVFFFVLLNKRPMLFCNNRFLKIQGMLVSDWKSRFNSTEAYFLYRRNTIYILFDCSFGEYDA